MSWRSIISEQEPSRKKSVFQRAMHPWFWLMAVGGTLLGVIWLATFQLSRVELRHAAQESDSSVDSMVETYEAQAVRTLHEIDQTLRVVCYSVQRTRRSEELATLRSWQLLPPSQLFDISVVGDDGRVWASDGTRRVGSMASSDPSGIDNLVSNDGLTLAWPKPRPGDAKLQFSRRWSTVTTSGRAVVEVDASFFVSSYDSGMLGTRGMLALTDLSGRALVRRHGDTIAVGDRDPESKVASLLRDPIALSREPAGADATASTTLSLWNEAARYARAKSMFGLPLAIVVGLDENERLAAARARVHDYRLRALFASLGVAAVICALGHVYWRLTQSHALRDQLERQHAAQIELLAYQDGLTELPNRRLFEVLVSRNVEQAQRYKQLLALLFIDLDGFKAVNDTLGHAAGDELLREAAKRLRMAIRDSDVLARLGGDEFAILLPQLDDEDGAAKVARTINNAISSPYFIDGRPCRVTASVGIACYPRDGVDWQSLVAASDAAMYQTKATGKNSFRFSSARPEAAGASAAGNDIRSRASAGQLQSQSAR